MNCNQKSSQNLFRNAYGELIRNSSKIRSEVLSEIDQEISSECQSRCWFSSNSSKNSSTVFTGNAFCDFSRGIVRRSFSLSKILSAMFFLGLMKSNLNSRLFYYGSSMNWSTNSFSEVFPEVLRSILSKIHCRIPSRFLFQIFLHC